MQKQITLIISLFLFIINVSLANSFQGEKYVTISEEVIGNLYAAGQNISVEAPIRGDLICAAGEVTIRDSITEDVTMVGGKLIVMGHIGDDLRVAGGTITIFNNINGDLIIAGGDVTIEDNVVITGQLKMAGGTLKMNGQVLGPASLRGGEIVWNGEAKNVLDIKASDLVFNGAVFNNSRLSANQLNLGPDAKFYANVDYWNPSSELDFGQTLYNGATANYNSEISFSPTEVNWRYLGVGGFLFWMYRTLTAALIIGLIIWMFHRFFSRNSEETVQHAASHLGYGLLFIVGIPGLVILTFLTVVGIPVGMLLIVFYGLTIALGHIIAALLIAYGLNYYYDKNWNRIMLFLIAVCAYLVLKVVGVIPVLGFIVSLFVVMMAVGTILYIWRQSRLTKASV